MNSDKVGVVCCITAREGAVARAVFQRQLMIPWPLLPHFLTLSFSWYTAGFLASCYRVAPLESSAASLKASRATIQRFTSMGSKI